MMGISLLILFIVFLLSGIPIAVAMGFSSMAVCVLFNAYPTLAIVHKIVAGVDSYVLISIPFFILAGEIMNTGGITNRIFNFANLIVGRIPGGMGHTNVFASIIFSGMSGSAVADTGGLGMIEMKAMTDKGYDKEFSAAVTCTSATIGPIIPPSIPLVVFGAMAEVSIGSLFIAGIIPGILMGLSLMAMIYYISVKRKYPTRDKIGVKNGLIITRKAILPMLSPVIIVGGILTGIITPTEAAIVATVYAFILSTAYGEMNLKELKRILFNTIINSATIIFIIGAATSFSWILTVEGIPRLVTEFILSVTSNKYLILILLNVILLVMGMFMEGLSILTIIVPFLIPLIKAVGMNPVHMGIMVVLNVMIGLSTPPVGMSLFVINKIAKVNMNKLFKEVIPLIIPLFIVLMLVTFIPEISMVLPTLILS
ncbi:MAG: TRAP transporter large permease [Sphaerochaetaceae bacterium]|nr:TRAP transporter large permease [Sphaerochaetaceae bacterium]MDC7250776.1 TRAP transporter large permease [Sphaerochaetaceae bacterium]